MLKRCVFVLTVSVFLVLSFAVHSKAGAQGGTPHPPRHIVPLDQSTITSGSTIQLCAQATDDITSEIHFEVFQGPIDDFSTPWSVANPQDVNTCAGMTLPNGHYTWHARARNSNGEGGNAPDWVFTLQVGSAPPPTRIPGPGASGNGNGNSGSGSGNGGTPPLSSAQQQGVPGGVDLIVYCYATGYTGAGNTNGTADGWVCTRDSISTPVDWNRVCKAVYGDNYVATKISNNPDGWRCVQGQQQVSQPSQPTSACGPNPSRLKGGDIAVVSDFNPDPLHVFNTASKDSGEIFQVSVREKVSIISGPNCADGRTWVEVGYNGKNGWAVEVNRDGSYNLIPNGQPLPGSSGSSQSSQSSGSGNPPSTNCNGVLPPHLTVGRNVVVTSAGDDLVLRAGDGLSQPKIDILSTGTSGIVLGGPRCTDGYQWWELQVKGKTGWAVESDGSSYWLAPEEQSVQPTLVPTKIAQVPSPTSVPQSTATPQPQANFSCGDLGFAPREEGVVYAADGISCVNYVRTGNRDRGLITCLQKNGWQTDENTGAAETVDAVAKYGKGCGVVGVYRAVNLDLGTISQYGYFLTVWGSFCGETRGAGHIAVFVSYQNGQITVDDANYPPSTPGGIHQHPLPDKDKSCVTLIQLSGSPVSIGSDAIGTEVSTPPYPQLTITWVFASQVKLSLSGCTTGTSSVEFQIPRNYTTISVVLHSVYENAGAQIQWGKATTLGNGLARDKVQFVLDSGNLCKLASKIDWQQLEQPSSWYVTFLKR